MSMPKAISRRRRAPTRAVMTAAETTGSLRRRPCDFLMTFTSLLGVMPSEGGELGEDEIQEGVGVLRRLAPEALHQGAEEGAEGPVLLGELAVGDLESADALAVLLVA